MLFSANIAVEKGVVVAVIVIALFIFTCRRSLKHNGWLVDLAQCGFQSMNQNAKKVEKGQKIRRAEAIQTGVINFQLYLCLSACSIDT